MIDYSKFRRDLIDFKKTADGRFIGKNHKGKVYFPDKDDKLITQDGAYQVIIYREFEKYIFCIGEKRL